MVMEGMGIQDLYGEIHGGEFFPQWNSNNIFKLQGPHPEIPNQDSTGPSDVSPGLSPNCEPSSLPSPVASPLFEGSEIFSDIVLGYINRMLMEEDIDEKLDMLQGDPALEATEKPFYDILGEKYPSSYPSSPDEPPSYGNHNSETKEGNIGLNSSGGSGISSSSCSSNNSNGFVDNGGEFETFELPSPQNLSVSANYAPQSSFSSTNSAEIVLHGLQEPLLSSPASQFRRGVEEAQKFLPSDNKFLIDLEAKGVPLLQDLVSGHSINESRGRKNLHADDISLEEGRSNKQSALDYTEETLRSEMFDLVLLCDENKCEQDVTALREVMQNESGKNSHNGRSSGRKSRAKKQPKSEVVDLRTLLTHCAQAVATDDRRGSNDLLKQIRKHSSPTGDGMQRLAHCFADGLEARLAGTGSEKYHSLIAKRVKAADILMAYRLYMAACPFKKLSYFFANQTILDFAEKASRVHVVDYGIYFGFHWPSIIQRLASRPGGPPELRITGIDMPEPGFRPAERIEETGRRIAEYARSFGVPFKYRAIAAKWETVKAEDLRIEAGETLIVNCLFQFTNVADESVSVECPRDTVLETIRKLKPAVFIHGVLNGSYGAPFFVTRFREALFHYSSLFDMLETNTPRDDPQRLLIERDLFGKQALNVIACEGSERVERPETYKQWHVRNLRAGLVPLPLNPDFMKTVREKVGEFYHRDFSVDEDRRWMLQGWKGRIVCAMSTWRSDTAR